MDDARRAAEVAGALRREAALILTGTMTASPTARGALRGRPPPQPLVIARAAEPVESPEVALEGEGEGGLQVDEELQPPRPPSGAAADADVGALPEPAEAERLRALQDLEWELALTQTGSRPPTSSLYCSEMEPRFP